MVRRERVSGLIPTVFSVLCFALCVLPLAAFAQGEAASVPFYEAALRAVTGFVGGLLFFDVFGAPFLVLWLIAGALFFTFRLRFVNFRLFAHAFKVIRGKYDNPDDPGEVTHFQAFSSAVSATVGIGNIGGVAVAVTTGGPGAVVWMMIAGFFGMSLKYAEVVTGLKYRTVDEQGRISGGAFHYLQDGLAQKGLVLPGKILAIIFAVFCLTGAFGAGNLFQANQAVNMIQSSVPALADLRIVPSLLLSFAVGLVLLGGIKRIAHVAEKIVPAMAVLYISGGFFVLFTHLPQIPAALGIMFSDAWTGEAIGGGMLGVIVKGLQRAAFSNEAGLGSAPIAHSASKTSEPVREGAVALLEPFLDTMVICMITGLVITVTGVYTQAEGVQGVTLTAEAFAASGEWLRYLLTLCAFLFAYSTMITWSYYGERSWHYLFGKHPYLLKLYYVIFCAVVIVGGMTDEVAVIVDFSDVFLLSMALPNLIGLYILSGDIARDTDSYIARFVKKGGQG